MVQSQNKLGLSKFLLLSLPFICGSAFAAKAVELNHQSPSILSGFISTSTAANNVTGLTEIKRSVDFNQTLHVRVQETYLGHPIWGADAVIHIPHGAVTGKSLAEVALAAANNKGSMNGTFYQNLNADLASTPVSLFTDAQAAKAVEHAQNDYQQKTGSKLSVKNPESKLMVYIDTNNKAHWAYQVMFLAPASKAYGVPANMIYLVDAMSFQIYDQWNNTQTNKVLGGGFGGNLKMGELVYDGLTGDLPDFHIVRDAKTGTCSLHNDRVLVRQCLVNSPFFWLYASWKIYGVLFC